ncbi:LysR family transcriptional regulator [Burkholderia arboris]|uniref:LysR family transcriptional regulator n=1 Tax=Burkholderia arboris TaxID=488730 RepID=UPI001CF3D7A2|nr:LysR family transcriptional regulator [Burkholderia arboris]MCA8052357.1 LysR family transcriptional regulator [Burkholderia arboris]
MKLKHLQALRAVADSGSIQEASRRLCLTQPAVSRIIREFESELGLPLLVRTTRGAILTEHADHIVKRASAIDREIDRISEYVSGKRGMLNGRLSIALATPAASITLINTIGDFANEWPNIEIEIRELRTQQIEDGLRDGVIDVAVLTRFDDEHCPPYQTELLCHSEVMLAVGAPYNGPLSLSLAELRELPWISADAVTDESSFVSVLVRSGGYSLPDRIIRCASISAYLGLAQRVGAVSGWGAITGTYLQRCIEEGTLQRIELTDYQIPRMSVFLAYPDRDLMTVPARNFALWLRNSIGQQGLGSDPRDFVLGF